MTLDTLNTLTQDEPWMTPQERDLNQHLTRAIAKHLAPDRSYPKNPLVALITEKLISHAASFLPPGVTKSKRNRPRSRWREFSYAFHRVRYAIKPGLSLRDTIERWGEIAHALTERPRKRLAQTERYFT